ncbi:MAG: NFACT RNA binding domain-containing protein [Nanoarchaeota archaeon]
MQSLIQDYKKYKWFITFSGKTVIGGKNALQNDELLKKVISLSESTQIMHTSSPGSPFSVILTPLKKITRQDIEECAIFTACFSQAWKAGKSKSNVDIFNSSQLNKEKNMKAGMWKVTGKVQRISVPLKLALTHQQGILRAVPEKTLKNFKNRICTIIPGKIDKKDLFVKIALEEFSFTQEEFLAALPAGGSKIVT